MVNVSPDFKPISFETTPPEPNVVFSCGSAENERFTDCRNDVKFDAELIVPDGVVVPPGAVPVHAVPARIVVLVATYCAIVGFILC